MTQSLEHRNSWDQPGPSDDDNSTPIDQMMSSCGLVKFSKNAISNCSVCRRKVISGKILRLLAMSLVDLLIYLKKMNMYFIPLKET